MGNRRVVLARVGLDLNTRGGDVVVLDKFAGQRLRKAADTGLLSVSSPDPNPIELAKPEAPGRLLGAGTTYAILRRRGDIALLSNACERAKVRASNWAATARAWLRMKQN